MKIVFKKINLAKYQDQISNSIFGFISLFIIFFSWFTFGFYSFGIIIAVLFGGLIFVSYKKDISIPFIKIALEREYYRVKFQSHSIKKTGTEKQGAKIIKFYLKVLYYLILLFKSSEESFGDIKDELFLKYCEFLEKKQNANLGEDNLIISKIKKGEKVSKDDLDKLETELFLFNKLKQKKVATLSLGALFILIFATIIAGLITSFIFPEVFKGRAASFGFLQTDWSGGASTTATALHPGNETGWTTYSSKDGVSTSTPGQLSLNLVSVNRKTETDNADWQTHATTSTYYLSGSVALQKPNGISCATVTECLSGFCIDGYCCNSACAGTCQSCSASGKEGTCSGITVAEDAGCTGICTSCVAGTCANRAGDDTTEGCTNDCYDCVAGTCSAVTQDTDGSCVACRTCVAGICSNRSADTQPSGCNSSCQYCDGLGACKTMFWSFKGSTPTGCNADNSGLTGPFTCNVSKIGTTGYLMVGNGLCTDTMYQTRGAGPYSCPYYLCSSY